MCRINRSKTVMNYNSVKTGSALGVCIQHFRVLALHLNYLCTYDLYSPVHIGLDACISITRTSGRGLGPENWKFFGPCKITSSRRAIWGPKISRFPGPNPFPLAQIMDMHASKTLCTRLYNNRCIGGFMHKKPTREVSGPILWGVEEQVSE